MKNVKLVYTVRNFLKNHMVQLKGPVGSIEGPRLVLDPMEVRFCVSLGVPWNIFCCLECKNIAYTSKAEQDHTQFSFCSY